MSIEMRCKKCNKLAPIDKEKSTKNWTVYKKSCSSCGGETGFALKGGEGNGEK